jgi:hypothetical protein
MTLPLRSPWTTSRVSVQRIGIDVSRTLPLSDQRNPRRSIAMDYFNKLAQTHAVRKKEASPVARATQWIRSLLRVWCKMCCKALHRWKEWWCNVVLHPPFSPPPTPITLDTFPFLVSKIRFVDFETTNGWVSRHSPWSAAGFCLRPLVFYSCYLYYHDYYLYSRDLCFMLQTLFNKYLWYAF